jgi:xanthine dehydrogenase small subunit
MTPARTDLPIESAQRAAEPVRFLLDEEIVELSPDLPPDRTVLQVLREDLGRTGTKEGCAEGDCGACTVVLAEVTPAGGLAWRAVNACIQFAPALAGKALITVESLGRAALSVAGAGASLEPRPALHPVQQALVDAHASQCGFCTPGFVMSLFAQYKTQARPDRAQIIDALGGNLCRCTGYRPIVEAALGLADAASRYPDGGHWLLAGAAAGASGNSPAEREVAVRLNALERTVPATAEDAPVVPLIGVRAGHRFFQPRDADELASLRQALPEARLLAGGTDVGLWVTKQHRPLGDLIAVCGVPGLDQVDESPEGLRIGAGVTLSVALPALERLHPALGGLFRRFASVPVRNAATLVGNLANGSPIGDAAPALMALGAMLTLRRGQARRELDLDTFYQGYQRNALQAGEFIESVLVPRPDPDLVFRTWKVTRRFDQDISAVSAGLALLFEAGQVREARLAFGGLDAVVRRSAPAEQALLGTRFDESALQRAIAALAADFAPIDDHRASAAYRRQVAGHLLLRLQRAWAGDEPPDLHDLTSEMA